MKNPASPCPGERGEHNIVSAHVIPGDRELVAELAQSAIGPEHRAILHYRRVRREEAQQLKGYSPARWDVEACPGDRLPVVISAGAGA